VATETRNLNTKVAEFFSAEEVSRLVDGAPDLAQCGPHLLVPFNVRRLRRATVFWINRRWFLERGIDVSATDTRERVQNWLTSEFGYAIPRSEDPPEFYTAESRVVFADRYGSSTGLTPHGGSGRVATIGYFQAKGVGVTPMAGKGANWVHSNGCASLEEGIREVIFSELAGAEFPYGAVPIIALLDTELSFCAPDSGQPMRRAIIVRPATLRLAHAERAPMFNHSLTPFANIQIEDAQRTRDVVTAWMSGRVGGLQVPSIPELFSRIVKQVAFGQIHRLFSGGYFSSNITITGALLDFGAMRALPNWVNAKTLDHAVGFGHEMKIIAKVAQSILFFAKKYGKGVQTLVDESQFLPQLFRWHEHAFTAESLRLFSIHATQDSELKAQISKSLKDFFSEQQRARANYKHGVIPSRPWLYDGVVNGAASTGAKSRALTQIDVALRAHSARASDRSGLERRAWWSASRYLMPRPQAFREELQVEINDRLAIEQTNPDESIQSFEQFIQSTIGLSRRHWPRLTTDMIVMAHVTCDGSTALLCSTANQEGLIIWLEGIRYREGLRLFNEELTSDEGREVGAQRHGQYWTARVSGIALGDQRYGFQLATRTIALPTMQISYRSPCSRFSASMVAPSRD
jgi:hypothetical protein